MLLIYDSYTDFGSKNADQENIWREKKAVHLAGGQATQWPSRTLKGITEA